MDDIPGRVIRARSGFYDVQRGDLVLRCTLRGRIKREQRSEIGRRIYADPVAVGDEVNFTRLDDEEGVIEKLLPRRTKLSRQYPGRREAIEQVVVANADQVIVVISTRLPDLNLRFLDRFLILAENGAMGAVICLNKMDLIHSKEIQIVTSFFSAYQSLGYEVIYTSVKGCPGVGDIRRVMKGKFSAIVGASGVGKSSLLNAIQPGLGLRVADVGLKTEKGRHTTTLVELLSLDFGGEVADTPGIREVGLWGVDTENVELYFREMEPYLGHCKYNDCAHIGEPGCAVIEAVSLGRISQVRHRSYIALRVGTDESEFATNELRLWKSR